MLRKILLPLAVLAALVPVSTVAQLRTRQQAYRLQPSDQLLLSYRYTPEFDETVTLQPDGAAVVKLIGTIELGNLTVEEAHAKLLEQLRKRLNDPELTVTLSDFVRPSFVVVGQVASPGKFEMHGPIHAIEAVAIAGGFKDNAKHSQVILYRKIDNDMAKTTVLDLKSLMNPKHPKLNEDVALEPGDILVVPKNRVSKVADYVHWVSVSSFFPLE